MICSCEITNAAAFTVFVIELGLTSWRKGTGDETTKHVSRNENGKDALFRCWFGLDNGSSTARPW